MPLGGGQGQGENISLAERRLRNRVDEWKEIRSRVADLIDNIEDARRQNEAAERNDGTPPVDPFQIKEWERELAQARNRRAKIVDAVVNIVSKHPRMRDTAIDLGFRADLLPGGGGGGRGDQREGGGGTQGPPSGGGEDRQDGGAGTGGGGGAGAGRAGDRRGTDGGGGVNLRQKRVDNRLLGDKGQDYYIVRGPKGSYAAVYTYKIAGETVRVGVRIPKGQLAKYGVKESDARQLTGAQMKRIKNIGWADELAPHIRRGDSNVLKSLIRNLRRQYGGQSILEDDEVMAVVIANSMFGWSAGEFENQLRNTKWYKDTTDYQRKWITVVSPKQKKVTIGRYLEQVVNTLEDTYGLDWMKHVEGGMKTARKWAERIASGALGSPDQGFGLWADRQFDKAAEIEGTPAWMNQQLEAEETARLLNRPEEMREKLRSEAMQWLGYSEKDTPRLDRDTLTQWATELVSGVKSEADWAHYLRQQMKAMYPHFDHNIPVLEQLSPYKATLEGLMGSRVGWDHQLLRDLAGTDDSGKPTGRPMSLHEFELVARDPNRNPEAFMENTPLYDEGIGMLSQVLATMRGVT